MKTYKAAICQMNSTDDKEANLKKAEQFLQKAALAGAKLVMFPETMSFMGEGYEASAETIPGPITDFFSEKAKEYGIWIVTGSFPETDPNGKPKNTLVLIGPDGQILCKYSKIHLFDVDLAETGGYRESHNTTAGDRMVVCDTPLGKLGFAICYDLRFPELFRALALAGAEVIILPASFATTTGQDHWEPLLRARAIENGVYLLATNQTGQKVNMNAYGHSMAVDPWGNILGELGDSEDMLLVTIDPDKIAATRSQLPSLANRKPDIYKKSVLNQNEAVS